MVSLKKPLAFIYKDFVSASSYRFSFVSQWFGIFFAALTFFFLSKLFGRAVIPYVEPYGGDYFSFVIIGIAFASYLQVSLSGFSRCIREAQVLGTLECLLVTQTEIPTIIISSSLYSFLLTSVRVLVYLLFGVLLFGLKIGGGNFGGALVILLLTIVAFSGLGIISASFVMVFKRGDPLTWLFSNASWLLGGVFYPVNVLPEWLQKVSFLLPITHSLEGMRMALLNGYTLKALLPNIIPLLAFIMVVLPMSLLAFNYAVRRAKIEGSLIQY